MCKTAWFKPLTFAVLLYSTKVRLAFHFSWENSNWNRQVLSYADWTDALFSCAYFWSDFFTNECHLKGQRPNEVQQRDTWFPQRVHEEQHHIFERKSAFQIGTELFDLAVSVWSIRSSGFGHVSFRSDYEIMPKSYINAKSKRLIQSKLTPSYYYRLPNVEAFHSKRTPFTFRNSGKRLRQGILFGIKFFVVMQSNWISGVSG